MPKNDQTRTWLVDALRTQLLPSFEDRGFQIVALPPRGPADREFKASFPLGRLRRAGQRGLDLVEIQLAPRALAAFRLNIGVAPPDGLQTLAGHVPAEDVIVGWLDDHYVLCANPRRLSWFAVSHWFGGAPSPEEYTSLAAEAARMMPEVEQALVEGRAGPHVRHVHMDRSRTRGSTT